MENALVNLSRLLARTGQLDHAAKRRDDEHLDRLGKNRPPDDDSRLEVTRVHRWWSKVVLQRQAIFLEELRGMLSRNVTSFGFLREGRTEGREGSTTASPADVPPEIS